MEYLTLELKERLEAKLAGENGETLFCNKRK